MLTANPIAHTADPATSHEAAEVLTRTGRRQRHADAVLNLVKLYPGRTAVELWQFAGDWDLTAELKEMQEVRRRLVDLEAAGKVRQGPARKCSVRGTRQVTWLPIEAQATLF